MEEAPKMVVFRLGPNEYALKVDEVREVLKIRDITVLPNSPDYVVGVTNIRGEITPIIDLRKMLHISEHSEKDSERYKDMLVMVVEVDNIPVGILVDAVSDVIQIPKENIEKVDGVGDGMGVDYVEGIGKIDNRLIIILNINKLIKSEGF